MGGSMKTWPIYDAKARFSEMLEASLVDGPQMVTQCGVEAAVLVSAVEWRRMHAAAKPSLKELLLAGDARTESLVPARDTARRRRVTPPLQFVVWRHLCRRDAPFPPR